MPAIGTRTKRPGGEGRRADQSKEGDQGIANAQLSTATQSHEIH